MEQENTTTTGQNEAKEKRPARKKKDAMATRAGSQVEFSGTTNIKAEVVRIGGTLVSRTEQYSIENYIREFRQDKSIPEYADRAQLNRYSDVLQEKRILLVDSYDYDVMFQVVTHMACGERFRSVKLKRLNFDRGDVTRKDILFQTVIEDYILKKKNLLLIIFINDKLVSQNFFEHMLSNDFRTALSDYQQKLTDKNCCIVVAVGDPVNLALLSQHEYKWKNRRMSVPYLESKLRSIFGDKEGVALCKKIEDQRRKEKWANDEGEFYKVMIRCLSEGAERFKKLIEEENTTGSASGYENIVAKDAENAKTLADSDDILVRYISFIAAHFENLTLSEFQFVALALLDDTLKTEVIVNPLKPDERIEKALVERWHKTADTVMRTIHLRESFSALHGSRVLDFQIQGFKEVFKEHFSMNWSWFCYQQFSFLFFTRKLLFRPETPYKVFENLIRISAEMANNDPDTYCQRLLIYTTFTVINQEAKIDIKIDPYEDDLETLFENYLAELETRKFEWELQKLEAFRKIGFLIAEMYKYENLRDRINAFFNQLIDHSLHGAVVFFTQYLRKVQGFDTLFWIRQLLERAPMKIKNETYLFLTRYLCEDTPAQTLESLKKIKGWHTGEQKAADYLQSAALCIFVDYLLNTIQRVSYEDYGQSPVRLHLFSAMENAGEIYDTLEFSTQWLLRPALKDAFSAIEFYFDDEYTTNFREDILPNLFILLNAIFTGVQNPLLRPNDKTAQFDNMMAELIHANASCEQIKELKTGFREWRDYYDEKKREEDNGGQSNSNRDVFFSLCTVSGNLLNELNKTLEKTLNNKV